jgi:translocation protein SEC72
MNIAKLKDSGNLSFKYHKFDDAARFFELAIQMALDRPPWEPVVLCRDETVFLLCNRSAARFALGQYPESLADAEAVVELKKPWAKGYFRKCKALQAMGRLEEAKATIELGLVYDPNDNECNLALKDIKKAIDARQS